MKKLALFLLSSVFFLLILSCGAEKKVEVVEDIV